MPKLLNPPVFSDPDSSELDDEQVSVFLHNAHAATQQFISPRRYQVITQYILALIEEEYLQEDLESGFLSPQELAFVFAYLAKMIWEVRGHFNNIA